MRSVFSGYTLDQSRSMAVDAVLSAICSRSHFPQSPSEFLSILEDIVYPNPDLVIARWYRYANFAPFPNDEIRLFLVDIRYRIASFMADMHDAGR